MAEEEVVAAAPSPVPSDHKRKLEDVESQASPLDVAPDSAVDHDAENNDVEASNSSDAKRPRLDDDKTDGGLATENGFQAEKSDEAAKEEEEASQQNEVNKQDKAGDAPPEEAQATVKPEQVERTTEETEQLSTDNHETTDAQLGKVESSETDNGQEPAIGKVESSETDIGREPAKEENKEPSEEMTQQEVDDGSTITRKMEVPNAKVGVLIGKAGDTIRYLQFNSGAKIQIMRDVEADLEAPTRPVEIIGTLSSIIKAEKLINAVIAEADAGGSPSLVARGLATTQAAGVADHIEIQVPNEKVGLIIGRGGETIKGLQTRSGARIQLIPQHLPEGDGSKERTVRVTGDKKQIEIAREMIKDVMSQTVRPSPHSGGFNQQPYRPRGTAGQPQWGPRGHPSQAASYDFQQRGPYPSQNSHYQPPPYGGYPSHQMAPRSNFGSSWEQRPHSMQGPPQTGGYDYYSRQGSAAGPHSTHIPVHAPGPSPAPAMGPSSTQSNYNYGQPHGPADYSHPPYSQAPHQHSYGHGYEEKYDHHTQGQHPYGGHGSSQPGYAQSGPLPGYAPQQQYGKPPSYQGPQTYGPPANQQEVPYQGPTAQSYGPNVPPQQQYPYASGAPMQQSYPPYGSAPPSDGYSQPPPVTGQAYPQQGTQPVPGYSQPSAQQATAYAPASTAAGYGQYPPPQQGYSEQPAPNNAGYGYQGAQDPAYGSAPATAYGAAPSGQTTYAQSTAAQPTYDQSVPQSGGYAAAPGSAPVAYAKTVSPQPGYPQYDSTQMYAAQR